MQARYCSFSTRMAPGCTTSEEIPHIVHYMTWHPLTDMDSPPVTAHN